MTINTTWQPINTIPHNKVVDIWIKSKHQTHYGRRATNICWVGGSFYGDAPPMFEYSEYASHWMPLPEPPKD